MKFIIMQLDELQKQLYSVVYVRVTLDDRMERRANRG